MAQFGSKEHVLLKSFGTFGSNTPTLDCVCDQCNWFFGKQLDQPFARDTLEGITRYKRGLVSRELRRQKGMRFSIADGEEGGELAGVRVKGIDSTTGKILGPIGQFLALNVITERYDVFPKEEIRGLKLPEDVYGKPGEGRYRVLASSRQEYDAVVEALRNAGISYREKGSWRPGIVDKIKAGETVELPVMIEGIIGDVTKRALVKMLFNFATYYFGKSETLMREWDKVRRFVRYGGEPLRMRASDKPFWNGQETEHVRFLDDSYNLRIENYKGDVIGAIQFYNLITYEFILVENYSLPPHEEIAYRFTPGEEPRKGIKIYEL